MTWTKGPLPPYYLKLPPQTVASTEFDAMKEIGVFSITNVEVAPYSWRDQS